jgi:hypothetical protein
MEKEQKQREHPLEKGQTWKLEHGYLHIVGLSKRFVYYRILRQFQEHVAAPSLIGVVELLIYLRHNDAELMNERNQPVMV